MEKTEAKKCNQKLNAAENGIDPVSLQQVKIENGFWFNRIQLVSQKIIPYQWEALNDNIPGVEVSGAIQNFRIALGDVEGKFYGRPFQDSDLAKWLEAVAYTLANKRDQQLEDLADSAIDLIARAQQPDGYLDTYFTIERRDQRWTNVRDLHELYCAGHLIEAAVAYYQATGKRRILDIVCRLADHIDTIFGPEPGKKKGYPGHPEIELALVKLYRTTGEERYLRLSKFFIDERGQQPNFFEEEAEARGDEEKPYGPTRGKFTYEYNQSHLPVREQLVAVGHAVRAMYLYSAMADLAKETEDQSLVKACKILWENVTQKQMYVIGAVGSSAFGEAFTVDYDLPNNTIYGETCAAIGLLFWAHRMLHLELDGQYADIIEKTLYNGILSGISLDGTKYFYVNPLEVWPESCNKRHDHNRVATVRQGWFACACCPPNIARLFASLSQYVYSQFSAGVYVHLYTDSSVKLNIAGQAVEITQSTQYPWQGTVEMAIGIDQPLEFTLGLRIPSWCKDYQVNINGIKVETGGLLKRGYLGLRRLWRPGDKVTLIMAMPVELVRANPAVRADAGKVAIQRGPLVYCLEEIDNGSNLSDISLAKDQNFKAEFKSDWLEGVVVITGSGYLTDISENETELYTTKKYQRKPAPIIAVPYYAWGNRKPGEMSVWIREE